MNNLSARQRIYGLLILGTVGVFVLFYAFMSYTTAYNKSRGRLNSLTADLDEIERNKQEAQRASERQREYRKLSLHSNPDAAKTLYNDWLLKTAADAGFENVNVSKQGPTDKTFQNRVIAYESRFVVKAECDLKELTDFLYQFHTADALHRIVEVNFQPELFSTRTRDDKSKNVDKNNIVLTITIEMISLPDGEIRQQIVSSNNQRLLQDALKDYTAVILPRNIFGFPNNPPRFLTKSSQEAEAGERVSISLRASDEDEDAISFEILQSDVADAKLTSASDGARFTCSALEVGEYHFKFIVKDDHPDSKSAELEMTLHVVEPPPPPKVAEKKPEPKFDPSSRTVITGIVRDRSGEEQVWIHIKPTGQRLKLASGEEFEVGPHQARVVEILRGAVVLEIDGIQGIYRAGDTFNEPREILTRLD